METRSEAASPAAKPQPAGSEILEHLRTRLGQTLQTLYNNPADAAVLTPTGFNYLGRPIRWRNNYKQALRPYPQYNSIGINAGP